MYQYILDYFILDIHSLVYTNMAIIRVLTDLLKIDKSKITQDIPTESKATKRLIDICKQNNCDTYLAAEPKAYFDMDLFKHHGIKVIYQDKTKLIKQPILEYLHEKVS